MHDAVAGSQHPPDLIEYRSVVGKNGVHHHGHHASSVP